MKKLLLLIILFFTFSTSSQTASEYFSLGKEQSSKRKYYQSIPNFKKAIEIDSTNLEYYWFLSEAILKENVRGSQRTDEGVFEGIELLNKMLSKGAKTVKVYERIATANQYVLDDYYNRFKNYKQPKTEGWQDDIKNTSEKERLKEIALNAYKNIIDSCNEILKIEPTNEFATSKLKYLKKPEF